MMFENCSGVLLLSVIFLLRITMQQDVQTKFSCQGRPAGYYADVDSGCEIYHMCDGLGRQFSYSCPNTTLFQQRMLICDHWYMVNCSRSEIDYAANLLIGQNKPFVEDSDKQPYYRTPRPDLLSQPTASEFNIVYRRNRAQNKTDLNLVGVNSDYDQNNGSLKSTERPAYHLPSHWSTEYSKDNVTEPTVDVSRAISNEGKRLTTSGSRTRNPTNFKTSPEINLSKDRHGRTNFRDNSNRPQVVQIKSENNPEVFRVINDQKPLIQDPVPIAKSISFDPNNLVNRLASNVGVVKTEFPINFQSLFKATTPVFPTKEELGTTEASFDDVLKPVPIPNSPQVIQTNAESNSNTQDTTDSVAASKTINFDANNLENRLKSDSVIPINFQSLFKATTPVFPTKEELVTTESPVDGILKPPAPFDVPPPEVVNRQLSEITQTNPEETSQNRPVGKAIKFDSSTFGANNVVPEKEIVVNFRSTYKATTPVFPTLEELGTTESPVDDILRVPITTGEQSSNANGQPLDSVGENVIINFQSTFKATTPVFPTLEELSTTELPIGDLLHAPFSNNGEQSSNFDRSQEFVPTPLPNPEAESPSKLFLPPIFLPDYTTKDSVIEENKFAPKTEQPKPVKSKSKPPTRLSSEKILKDIRKMFSIPDYEFPLDNVSRPSYNERIDSFQVNPFLEDVQQRQHAS